MKLGEHLYQSQQGGAETAPQGDAGFSEHVDEPEAHEAPKEDHVVDAEFTEVDDEHRKNGTV